MSLGSTFRKLGGGAMALSLVAFPMAANADDEANTAPVQTMPTTASTVNFLSDAHFPADAWVANQPDHVAVSVRVGTATTPQIIEKLEPISRRMLHDLGIEDQNIRVFLEKGSADGSGMMIHTNAYVSDPFPLIEAPKKFEDSIRKMRLKPVVSTKSLTSSLN